MAFAITAQLRSSCSLPASSLRWQERPATEPFASESDPPYSVSAYLLPDLHELRLHIWQRSWRRARRLCGFLACAVGSFYATSETDWLSSNVLRLGCWNLVRLACHCLLSNADCTRYLLGWISPVDWSDCCSRPALQLVHWLSRLVLCRTSRLWLRRLADDLMIDLGCLNLRHHWDSGLFFRRSVRFWFSSYSLLLLVLLAHLPFTDLLNFIASSPSCFVVAISTPLSWTLCSSVAWIWCVAFSSSFCCSSAAKLVRVCALPTAITLCSATATVVAWESSCTSVSIIFLSSFVSNFRLCSKLPSHLRFCQRGKVWMLISLWHRLSPQPSSPLSVLPLP